GVQTCALPISEAQIAADLLVERLTGQESATAVPTEIHLIMQASSLLEPGEEPAWFPGVGPIPAQAARDFVTADQAAVFVRRLYTRPEDGQLVRMDSRRREFSGLLRRMVVIRDDVCRSPWCEAPIKHADHADSFANGGETGWNNSSGLCAACNYAKELAGWRHKVTSDGLEVVTPTGHHYRSSTKPISRPDPGPDHDEDVAEASSGHRSDTGPPGEADNMDSREKDDMDSGEKDDMDSGGTDAGTGSTGSDPPRTVLIPWRFRPREKTTVEVAGTTIGVEIF